MKQTAKNEDLPVYKAIRLESSDDQVIAKAIDILNSRMIVSGDILNSPEVIRRYLRLNLTELEHEVFVVMFLDAQHQLIASEEMFRGTLTQTSVYPREVVKRSLHHNAAAVVFAHNHPSGCVNESSSDRMLTNALKQALALVDVRVLDHFIVAGKDVGSFCEKGLL